MVKATGIVRHIDDLGRVVVPKELRRTLHIKEGDALEFYVDGDAVVIKKYQPGCVICDDLLNRGKMLNGKLICFNCLVALGEIEIEK